MKPKLKIGYNRRVDYQWLEYTAQLAMSGNGGDVIREALGAFLQDKLSVGSDAKRGSREKTITILMKTWVKVPEHLEPLRRAGLALFKTIPKTQHPAVHWGMTMAVYPFWGVVAAAVGRILRLQETVTTAQIQRRVHERLGEREMVSRSARYVTRAFVNWGVLDDASQPGLYRSGLTFDLTHSQLIAWLVEAHVSSSNAALQPLKSLLDSPALFPFRLFLISTDKLACSDRLEVIRHGLDEDMVMLRPATVS